jgi:peptide-methionine (S)-S-oxide reductase
MQLVFKHVKGVTRVVAGYSGGEKSTAIYEAVGTGRTGHAESVQVTFDTSQISYAQLLKVLFAVHDPTTLNRQGPDVGTEYRSAIFYANDDQKRIAQATIAQLTQAKAFSSPIVTEVAPMRGFYPAEDYHQDYAVQHPTQPYIAYNDLPKLDVLKRKLPELYREHYGL